jgi:hypothetical protein
MKPIPTVEPAHRFRGIPTCANTDEEARALCRRVEKMTPAEARAFAREQNAASKRKAPPAGASLRPPTSRIDTGDIYAKRRSGTDSQAAPARPRSMTGIAAAYYGGQAAAGSEGGAIGTSSRGGGQ